MSTAAEAVKIGDKFGRRIVIGPAERDKQSRIRWLVRCDCGTENIVPQHHLRNRRASSCGCLKRDLAKIIHLKHGHTKEHSPSPTYHSWLGMWARCANPNHSSFHNYGGKGVSVCSRWSDFSNFLEDMGEKSSGLSIDRYPNPCGNYEPANCRWATRIQQQRNTRQNHIVMFNGRPMSLAEAAELAGIPYKRAAGRIHRGWNPQRALTEPRSKQGVKQR